jgi:glycosyltransferase involved in cell wall biosynthesis
MDISVVLGTYNRAASLQVTLESFSTLLCSEGLTWELLVVDNNSTDNTQEVIEAYCRHASFSLRYLYEQRQGRSWALNAGIAQAKGAVIAFTDDDVVLHPEWLISIKQTFDQTDCSAVAGKVVPVWAQPKPYWLEMDEQQAVVNFDLGDERKEIYLAPLGANSAFRRELFETHGLFRPDLGVNGSTHTITCDDTEFGERLIRDFQKIVYCPFAIVYHPVDPKRATKDYFLSWYYYNGRSLTRMAGLSAFGVRYFGVPRWLYRELFTNIVKWLFSFNVQLRFHHKLRAYRSLGNIVESYLLSHRVARSDIAAAVSEYSL